MTTAPGESPQPREKQAVIASRHCCARRAIATERKTASHLPGSMTVRGKSSLKTPIVRMPCSVDAGRTAGTRPVRCRSMAPGFGNARAPALGLSTLNSMAFGLAVYASRCGLPHPRARLASGRWSGATGRAFHPQGPIERFLSASYISSPFPKPLGAIRNAEASWGEADRLVVARHFIASRPRTSMKSMNKPATASRWRFELKCSGRRTAAHVSRHSGPSFCGLLTYGPTGTPVISSAA